jgi:hypothetical protein
MAAIIDSAPDCITREAGTEEARVEDTADFVIGNNWQDCAGFMTFGPGSTYETVDGPGVGAEGAYMVLTWIGIGFMVLALLAWVAYENRRLVAFSLTQPFGGSPDVPQPGMTTDVDEGRPG